METWFVIVVTLCIVALIRSTLFHGRIRVKLPPGPSFLYSTFLLLTNHPLKFEQILISLMSKYGPFITLPIGLSPFIFVASHSLAHEILIKKGAFVSDRSKTIPALNISTASYGPTWRLLRRNLASEVMHPYRIKSYSWARKWALLNLIGRFQNETDGVNVVDHFHSAVFSLLVLMCFGEKFDEGRIKEIAKLQRDMLLVISSSPFTAITLAPRLGKILFRSTWKEFERLRISREQVLIPIIKSRIESANSNKKNVAYVDTLVNLQLPQKEGNDGNGGKLAYRDMVSMCSEFLNGGTDTTSTTLQWIMANLVKHPCIQSKLYDEIVAVVGPPPSPPQKGVDVEAESVIDEEELKKMRYLKAVVLEGLRRHPPGHFVLPHKVTKEIEVQGYVIPQGVTVNFLVAKMGLDSTVWDDPMDFNPERFWLNDTRNNLFDISGSKGIKMMPFGAGRRICPGSDLALLHLEYFVANLIWYFHWTNPNGYQVDLSEKIKFTVTMKNPLRAQISFRAENRIT